MSYDRLLLLLVLLVGLLAPWCELMQVLYLKKDVLPDKCTLPVKVGRCRAAFPRYYYDAKEMKCKNFTFGGCRGNRNNFLSREDCISECQSSDQDGLCAAEISCCGAKSRYKNFLIWHFSDDPGHSNAQVNFDALYVVLGQSDRVLCLWDERDKRHHWNT